MAEPPEDGPDESGGDDATPGDEPADAFDEIQTQLMHAREGAERSISEPLNQVTQALDSMQDEAETDARPDRLESLERELLELQSDANPETKAQLRDAAERLRELQKKHEREGADEESGS